MKSAKVLREKLAKGELTLGCLVTNHFWIEFLEIAKYAGFDFVIIDLEHHNHGDTVVSDACRLGRMTDFPVLIRPARTDAESVRLAMDLGPCGLMLPMIESTEQLDGVRDGIWMPPRGQRRPGGHGNWWVSDFNYKTWKSEVEDNFVILTQIESPRGVKNAMAIAQHEITTSLAVGPYDLSARLGACWEPENADLIDAVAAIRAAAKETGKPMWVIGDGQKLVSEGYNFVCVAEPSNFLKAAFKQMVSSLRAGDGGGQDVKAFVP